ncbi:MAG: NADH:flavin oxidoreductase/NADH oxidase [Candidatus Kaistia colombiensis]|nr:MAG: NADH:flavin oxidoreductase/NADH oxidase [Kaistia sp.]
MSQPPLFSPWRLRGASIRNRVALSPMCMYCARDGLVSDFHMSHYAGFAMGGTGLVWLEATAIRPEGRISNGCLGIWDEAQLPGLTRLATHIASFGAVPGIQLNHAGRKAAAKPAWAGGAPLTPVTLADGERLWQPIGPSDVPFAEGWQTPRAMSLDDIAALRSDFVAAAQRAVRAGFKMIELHFAHGYLIQSFLSPLANHRTDAYGGSLENRMRLAAEIAGDVREAMPAEIPLVARISATDWIEGGWTLDDSLVLARLLKGAGVDMLDVSSGGNMVQGVANSALTQRSGYQTDFAHQIRTATGLPVQTVGLIRSAAFANQLLEDGKADMVALGRQMLFNPRWAAHAFQELAAPGDFSGWPAPYGWWLEKWSRSLARKGESPFHRELEDDPRRPN